MITMPRVSCRLNLVSDISSAEASADRYLLFLEQCISRPMPNCTTTLMPSQRWDIAVATLGHEVKQFSLLGVPACPLDCARACLHACSLTSPRGRPVSSPCYNQKRRAS